MTIAINAYHLGKPEQGFGRFTEKFLDSIVTHQKLRSPREAKARIEDVEKRP
ncbi:MAG: hypothetical protein KAS64_07205 [Spirochaetes bacterium]|nr:hypothetical protein [Spirochaetota bacterium]